MRKNLDREDKSPPISPLTVKASKLNVLIIDDEPFNLIALEGLLQLQGVLLIDKCFNGKEAIALLEDKGFSFYDIVFTDLNMPQATGIEVAIRIREENQHVMIILVTGDNLVEDKEDLFNEILQKPFKTSDL